MLANVCVRLTTRSRVGVFKQSEFQGTCGIVGPSKTQTPAAL